MKTVICSTVYSLALALIVGWPALANEGGYRLLERQPHDPEVFTQGFVIDGDWFYESSGQYGRSFLLRYARDDSSRAQRQPLPRNIFAEGITMVGDRLYLLSWKAGKAWALDKESLEPLAEFSYRGEGWGLAWDGEHLIMSDGSDRLRFYDKQFNLLNSLRVRHRGEALDRLNELEYHNGIIWANRWYSDEIYGIDPGSGRVSRTVDLSGLRRRAGASSREHVLNGIAWDPRREAFWVTGKYWPYRYLIALD